MTNVNINLLYKEIKLVRKKLETLENILIPLEIHSTKELKRIDKLRAAALKEYKKGQTINVDDL